MTFYDVKIQYVSALSIFYSMTDIFRSMLSKNMSLMSLCKSNTSFKRKESIYIYIFSQCSQRTYDKLCRNLREFGSITSIFNSLTVSAEVFNKEVFIFGQQKELLLYIELPCSKPDFHPELSFNGYVCFLTSYDERLSVLTGKGIWMRKCFFHVSLYCNF